MQFLLAQKMEHTGLIKFAVISKTTHSVDTEGPKARDSAVQNHGHGPSGSLALCLCPETTSLEITVC